MIEPEKPSKKKDQILIDEEIAQKLQAQLNAELEEEEKLAKQREEDANIKEHFARLRAEEQRRKPPTNAQKRNQMCTYLKNMAGFTHSQLKNKSFDEVQKAFNKTMGWIDSFVSIDSKVVKGDKEKDEGSVTRAEESSTKRAGTTLEQERIKKQKIDDDQEEAKMKKHMEIVVDEEEIAVDAIPLATKPLIIVDWKIIKEGKMGYFQLIRVDGSLRRNTRLGEAYERVLWGDLKVMFEPDVESEVWRNLQGYNVTVWKLFSSSGVHFVRFQNLQIFILGRTVRIKRLHDDLGVNTAKALKNCNPDLIAAGEKRMFQLHELVELRHQAYKNSYLYKERTKVWHDMKLKMRKEFKHRNKVLLFHSKYKFKQPKLRSRWQGPYVVKHQYPSGYVELYEKDGKTFIVNGHRLKLYHEEEDYNDQRKAVTPLFPKE
ncbi:hypothetical protein Tco_0634660 [Tanacetum coccineum]